MDRNTVAKIVQLFKNEDCLQNAKRSGLPKILMECDERFLMHKIKVNPKISAPKLTL